MKTKVIDKTGKAKKEIELPQNFSAKIRKDILQKLVEAQKGLFRQPYGVMEGAGGGYSASGILRHKRHAWKVTYGKGISRVPRKIMSRHGASFNWVGATVASARGGRRPHAPRSEKIFTRKINRKELLIGINSALTGTFENKSAVFDSEVLALKTKDFKMMLDKVFENLRVWKEKSVRAGAGKARGRKYKSNAGLVFVIANNENMNRKGIDVVKVKDLTARDLAPNGIPGRLAAYTENSIKEIAEVFK